jgi:FkbM family methyltransferase
VNVIRSTVKTLVFKALRRVRPAPLAALLKRALRVERRVHQGAEGKYWLDPVSHLGAAVLTTGEYEADMGRTLKKILTPSSVFVDLGANEGYFTVLAGKLVGDGGSVIAIEPQTRLLPVIEKNLSLNGLENVKIVSTAVSDRSGTATLYLLPDLNSGGSSFHRPTRYAVPEQKTDTVTLEQVLTTCNLEKVDLLKVDIEGAEYEALLGSPALFEHHRIKAVALELHPQILAARGKSATDIESFLTKNGYRKANDFDTDVWLAPN